MPRTIAPYGRLREECRVAFHHGRPASVEPADILLLLDRVEALEAVAAAARKVGCETPPPGLRRDPGCIVCAALARLDRLSNPPRVAGKAKR